MHKDRVNSRRVKSNFIMVRFEAGPVVEFFMHLNGFRIVYFHFLCWNIISRASSQLVTRIDGLESRAWVGNDLCDERDGIWLRGCFLKHLLSCLSHRVGCWQFQWKPLFFRNLCCSAADSLTASTSVLTPIALSSLVSDQMTIFRNSFCYTKTTESTRQQATFCWCDSFFEGTNRISNLFEEKEDLAQQNWHSAEAPRCRSGFVQLSDRR
jgi:hypothetical protein